MRLADTALVTLIMAVWGFNFVVAKSGLQEMPPMLLVALRFVLVAALLLPFVKKPTDKLLQIFALSVTMGCLHFGLMFTALRNVDAAVAAIAIQVQVPFSALLAAIFFNDKLGWRRAGGMAVAFAGIVLIAGEPRMATALLPLLTVISASMLWAIGNVQIKQMGPINGVALNAWMALFTAPLLLLASLLFETGQLQAIAAAGWKGWGAVAYMGLMVTIFGYGFWYSLVRRYDVNQTMPYTLLAPVFGVISGVVVLEEALTWQMMVGAVLTLVGVAIIVLRRPALTKPEMVDR